MFSTFFDEIRMVFHNGLIENSGRQAAFIVNRPQKKRRSAVKRDEKGKPSGAMATDAGEVLQCVSSFDWSVMGLIGYI